MKQKLKKRMENKAYLGLGSNKGERENFLSRAIQLIDEHNSCKVLEISSIYESKPYGKEDQKNFLNCVALVNTNFTADELFDFIKSVESKVGRTASEKWGPREIDIDVLFYNDLVIETDKICIPHKDMLNRDFVLAPMCEIEPKFIHPVTNKLLSDHLKSISENYILSRRKIVLFNLE